MTSGMGMKNTPRNRTAMRRKLAIESGICRICGWEGVDPHHVVYRSLGGTDEPENVVGLCRACHNAVHAKTIDLGSYLTRSEAAKSVLLLGSLERAHVLLYPSEHRKVAA